MARKNPWDAATWGVGQPKVKVAHKMGARDGRPRFGPVHVVKGGKLLCMQHSSMPDNTVSVAKGTKATCYRCLKMLTLPRGGMAQRKQGWREAVGGAPRDESKRDIVYVLKGGIKPAKGKSAPRRGLRGAKKGMPMWKITGKMGYAGKPKTNRRRRTARRARRY